MKKLFLAIFIVIFLIPGITHSAGSKKIGEQCSDPITGNGECITNDCEDSNLNTIDEDNFCVCETAQHCANHYGGSVADWKCSDAGDNVYYALHYCQKTTDASGKPTDTGEIMNPLKDNTDPQVIKAAKEKGAPGLKEAVFDPEESLIKFQSEIGEILQTPQPKINIPGLDFSKINVEEMVTQDADGTAWLNIPFLGEYLSAIYKYAMVVMGLAGVIGIIMGGVTWMMSGASSDGNSKAQKQIIGSGIAVVIAVTSYTLLHAINPELVQFRNLKVLYVRGIQYEEIQENDDPNFNPAKVSFQFNNLKEGEIPCDNPTQYGLIKIPPIKGIKYLKKDNNDYLLPAVMEGLKKLGEVATSKGYIIGISTACRTTARQQELADNNPAGVKLGTTAKPGKSPHGYGYAIDVHLLKDGKDLTCPSKEKCIIGEGSSGKQCTRSKENPEILDALKIQNGIFFEAGWVRLTTESWHYEYGTAGKYCRGECTGLASLCNGTATNDCPQKVNGCSK